MKTLFLFPHQLFPVEKWPEGVERVVLAEDPLFFGTDKKYPLNLNKQKIVFHRATMRSYFDSIPKGIKKDYLAFDQIGSTADLFRLLSGDANNYIAFEPSDYVLRARLLKAAREGGIDMKFVDSPGFIFTETEATSMLGETPRISDFYKIARRNKNILMQEDEPVGGKWSFDSDNQKKLPRNYLFADPVSVPRTQYVSEAIRMAEDKFPNNPGNLDIFLWPTTRESALLWARDFFENRFVEFGDYEDALTSRSVFINHSGLSALINCGLLMPQEVLDMALQHAEKHKTPINSVEGFVRQILGWREFMRAVYARHGVSLRRPEDSRMRRLGRDWYSATTGIAPIDDAINKVLDFGYAHHIERLMILGNAMYLLDVSPHSAYEWFMEMFIDAYDWVMVPNIYGMSYYSSQPRLVTKPYIAGSNYIRKMSDYAHGDWETSFDSLFWNFVASNRDVIASNPRIGMMSRVYERLPTDKKDSYKLNAKQLKDRLTSPN